MSETIEAKDVNLFLNFDEARKAGYERTSDLAFTILFQEIVTPETIDTPTPASFNKLKEEVAKRGIESAVLSESTAHKLKETDDYVMINRILTVASVSDTPYLRRFYCP